MTKQTHINVGGSWKQVNNVWQRVSGEWKEEVMPKIKVGGDWKECMEYRNKSLIKYGKLYQWSDRLSSPSHFNGTLISGMVVPTDAQWIVLNNYIVSTYNVSPNDFGVGNHLKHPRKNGTPILSSVYNTSIHPRFNAHETHFGRDTVNFGSLPGGYRIYTGTFNSLGAGGFYWCNSAATFSAAFYRSLSAHTGNLYRYYFNKEYAFSVRCVRDATAEEQSSYNDGDVIEQVTDYDDNVYDCILIGEQVWTKQNLATTHFTNGTTIPSYDYNNNDSNTFFANEEDSIW